MKKDFDYDLDKKLNEDIQIPNSILKKKELAFDMIKKSKKKNSKKKWSIAAAAALIILIGGVTFGNDAIAEVKEMLFKNNSGVQTAIDNGYAKKLENLTMNDQGVKISVDKFLIDNERAAVSMKINFEDKTTVEDLKVIKVMSNLKVNGESISGGADNELTINEDTKEITYNTVFALKDGSNYDSVTLEITGIDLIANINSKVDWAEGLSKLDIDQISNEGFKLYKIIEGNWKADIGVKDEFKDFTVIPYKASEENKSINIVSANLNPTGMDIKFNFKDQKGSLSKDVHDSVYNIKLTDDKGKSYKDNGMTEFDGNEDGKTDLTKTFGASAFTASEYYILEIKDLEGEVQKIKLVK